MKRIFVIMLVIFIVNIVSFWTFDYVIRDGDFTKWSHTTMGYEHYEDGLKYYLGYDFNWEGIGKPTLEKVEFNKILQDPHDQGFLLICLPRSPDFRSTDRLSLDPSK